MAEGSAPRSPRWELYRLLAEPSRLRVLALAAQEELGIGELAELLGESQSGVSRHTAALRQAGLLKDRREGTRTLVSVTAAVEDDPVVADALASGRSLCEKDGSLGRIDAVVRAREAAAHEFFARPFRSRVDSTPAETGAYLAALGQLLPRRSLALDAGTGDGRLLDVLAPVFLRVVAIDRSGAQLARARERVAARGFENVTLLQGELEGADLRGALNGGTTDAEGIRVGRSGADAVFASRILHHAPQPGKVVSQLASLCAPGGALVLIDYERHEDEGMRNEADAWLGFEASELRRFAHAAGLRDIAVSKIPGSLCGDGVDSHLPWQVLVGKKPETTKENHHG